MTLRLSDAPVRHLDADSLGIGSVRAMKDHGSSRPDDPDLREGDPLLLETRKLLEHYGGVIFSGPPGTSKSWYAAKIGSHLSDHDPSRIRFVQFHPSYQYEDFMQGYVPNPAGDGFKLVPKTFLSLCREAEANENKLYVLVIDELSRADPGRVFGEALTYIERSKRGLPFSLASGDESTVPPNLVLLATMNPFDRGVDDVDAAFERRFAKIAMEPDATILAAFLDRNGITDPLRRRVLAFFSKNVVRSRRNTLASVGHTFFIDVSDEDGLSSLWAHQLQFLFRKAFRLDPAGLEEVERDWSRIFGQPELGPAPSSGENSSPGEDDGREGG